MPSAANLIAGCSSTPAAKSGERMLIRFVHRKHYEACLTELKASGVHSVKCLPYSRLICVHVDPARKQALAALRRHPHVHSVEPDGRAAAHDLPSSVRSRHSRSASARAAHPQKRRSQIPWNVCRVQAPAVWPITKGACVKIAILDTGIGPNPDLRVAGGVNTITGGSYRDDNGHGTHVAGIAAARGAKCHPFGVAPRAALYAVKVLDATGSGYVSDIIEGIEWCIRNRMQVINMSFGLFGGESPALHAAVRQAYKRGIALVASAGNNGPFNPGLDAPASYPQTMAVAASTRSNRIAPFSSRGKRILVAAPGNLIRSTKPGGGYAVMSGTSMAAPHVAGGAALLLARYPGIGPKGIACKLRRAARVLPGYGPRAQGAGLLQLARAAGARKPCGKHKRPCG
ncbi:S8 family peptidase [Paenibacillus methanolicus]|uniref:Minor extracellular protease Epr n=1 Tax=Paenibacillus methanolicus TaxID=582686 RepID=A0A5S5CHY3_9BACL|nr:S8 family peptidase [Paenibacillus methanolicus]TYP77836.1 minor extracellular protease Epr [Paenibacillus methanolicus]